MFTALWCEGGATEHAVLRVPGDSSGASLGYVAVWTDFPGGSFRSATSFTPPQGADGPDPPAPVAARTRPRNDETPPRGAGLCRFPRIQVSDLVFWLPRLDSNQ